MTETIDPRRIAYLPLAELTADPRNPKAHDDEVIEKSIGRFGMLDPIVRDERTGFIVSGHGRSKSLLAMEKRGETAPEGVRTDPETGAWLVPVVVGWGSRTDAEAGAALIALNRTTELGGWVDEALLDLLDDLADMEDGFEGIGFTEEDREALEHLTYSLEEDGPRDLDELHVSVGDPTEEDKLQRFSLLLDADLAAELAEYVGKTPEDHASAARLLLEALRDRA